MIRNDGISMSFPFGPMLKSSYFMFIRSSHQFDRKFFQTKWTRKRRNIISLFGVRLFRRWTWTLTDKKFASLSCECHHWRVIVFFFPLFLLWFDFLFHFRHADIGDGNTQPGLDWQTTHSLNLFMMLRVRHRRTFIIFSFLSFGNFSRCSRQRVHYSSVSFALCVSTAKNCSSASRIPRDNFIALRTDQNYTRTDGWPLPMYSPSTQRMESGRASTLNAIEFS